MRIILVYGLLSGAIVIAVIALGLFVALPSHFQSEWFGYLVMVMALALIFVGMKRYRDVERGGVVRFLPAFGLGIGIAAFAGIVYVIGWEAALALSGRDFIAEYGAAAIADARARGAAADELARIAADMAWAADIYRSAPRRMAITFLEIFPVGLIVALVSAALLRNPRLLPARAA